MQVFAPEQLVKSRFSGVVVKVTGDGVHPSYFSGTVLNGNGIYEEGEHYNHWYLKSFVPCEDVGAT